LFETKGASKEDFAKVAAVINTEIYSVRSIKKFVSKRSSKRPL